jgi:hypothetical protein
VLPGALSGLWRTFFAQDSRSASRLLLYLQMVGEAAPGATGAAGSNDAAGGEFEFLGSEDKPAGDDAGAAGLQTLAPATEEQAAAAAAARSANPTLDATDEQQAGQVGAAAEEDEGMQNGAEQLNAAAAPDMPAAPAAAASAQATGDRQRQRRGAAAQREPGALTADMPDGSTAPPADTLAPDSAALLGDERQSALDMRGEAALVALRLERTSLGVGDAAADDDAGAVPLTEEQLVALRAEAEASLTEWRNANAAGADQSEAAARAAALWARFEALTAPLASELCEQLRLILEPTLAARMQGDYRTGKRLNMRKIIPYLASDFRRDKIWLRRSKPSVRRYQARALPLRCACVLSGSVSQLSR